MWSINQDDKEDEEEEGDFYLSHSGKMQCIGLLTLT